MLDWNVREEALPPESPPLRPARRPRWRKLVAALSLLLIVGAGFLWQSRQREVALRSDLQGVIDEEERARSFGLVNEAASFAVGGVSERWLSGYRYRFQREKGEPPLPEVMVEAVVLHDGGRRALVTVQTGHDQRLRTYGRTAGAWRRAPLPHSAWGSPQRTELDSDLTLHYRELDAPFATQLASEWPILSELVTRVPLTEIHVEPVEFRAAAYYDWERGVLRLASPQLVRYDPWLSGAEVVRYELARKLLRGAWPVNEEAAHLSHRVIRDAFYEVAALHWALAPERLDQLREQWRDQVATPWHSPFDIQFAELDTLFEGRPAMLSSQGALTMLLADLLHVRTPADQMLPSLMRMDTLIADEGWAERLLAMTGEGRYSLDARLERYVAAGFEAAREAPSISAPRERVSAVGRFEPQTERWDPLLFTRSDSSRSWPLALETTSLDLPGGPTLPLSCRSLFDDVQLSGYWQAAPSGTLAVDRLWVDELRPRADLPVLDPVPEGAVLLSRVAPTVVRDDQAQPPTFNEPARLAAHLWDGTRQILFDDEQVAIPTPALLDGVASYTIRLHPVKACNASWLYLLDQEQRYLGPWLLHYSTPFPFTGWDMPQLFTVEPGERWLMVTRAFESQSSAWLLDATQTLVEPVELPMQNARMLGWQAATERLLFWSDERSLLALSLNGATERVLLPGQAQLPMGHYAASSDRLVTITDEQGVISYDLGSGRREVLLPPPPEDVDGHRAILELLEKKQQVVILYYPGGRDAGPEIIFVTLEGEVVGRTSLDDPRPLDFITCPNDEVLVLQRKGVPDASDRGPTIEVSLHRLVPGATVELMTLEVGAHPFHGLACVLGE